VSAPHLHCFTCERNLSDREWGEAQLYGGQCRGCRERDLQAFLTEALRCPPEPPTTFH